jgi:hydroxymethylpyrimidine pyrophosphatase-like HAD family hydrolase
MRYHILATDYDGTLAHNGLVLPSTIDALKQFLASGRHLVLVTGRELPDLLSIQRKYTLPVTPAVQLPGAS